MRARWVLVSGLLIAAAAASAVPPGEHIDVEQTSCWECHAPGLWQPPMEAPAVREYRFDPGPDGWVLTAVIHNNWTHELRSVAGLLTLPDGWGYGGDTNRSVKTFEGSMDPGLGQEQQALIEFEVPEGTQRLTVRASYESQTPHQFDLEVHPGLDTPWGDVVRNGSYEEVTYDAEDFAAAGWGTWRAKVSARSDLEVPSGMDYTVEVIAEQAPQGAWLSLADDILPGEDGEIQWRVDIADDTPEQAASLVLFTDTYYEHEEAENPDLDHMRTPFTFPVQVRSGSPLFIEEEPEDDEVIPGASIALLAAALAGAAMVTLRRR